MFIFNYKTKIYKLTTMMKVQMIDKESNKLLCEFYSEKEAADYIKGTGVTNAKLATIRANICATINGWHPTAYGYKWKYVMPEYATAEYEDFQDMLLRREMQMLRTIDRGHKELMKEFRKN